MYSTGARILLNSYTIIEKSEAMNIINWVLRNHKRLQKNQASQQIYDISGCSSLDRGTKKIKEALPMLLITKLLTHNQRSQSNRQGNHGQIKISVYHSKGIIIKYGLSHYLALIIKEIIFEYS